MGKVIRVLYAEDNIGLHSVIELYFRRHSIEVDIFADGATALEAFKRNPGKYDVVVTDFNMLPDMNGFELCESVKGIRPVPCILCSGSSQIRKILTDTESSRFDARFNKPIDFPLLLAKIIELGGILH